VGREGLGDFTSTLFILFPSPSSLDGCHNVGAGVLMFVGWQQCRDLEEQAGDVETGDQRSLCISCISVLCIRIYDAN